MHNSRTTIYKYYIVQGQCFVYFFHICLRQCVCIRVYGKPFLVRAGIVKFVFSTYRANAFQKCTAEL